MVGEVKGLCSSLSQKLGSREQREVLAVTGRAAHLTGWHSSERLDSALSEELFPSRLAEGVFYSRFQSTEVKTKG